jgi:hypothetical protein
MRRTEEDPARTPAATDDDIRKNMPNSSVSPRFGRDPVKYELVVGALGLILGVVGQLLHSSAYALRRSDVRGNWIWNALVSSPVWGSALSLGLEEGQAELSSRLRTVTCMSGFPCYRTSASTTADAVVVRRVASALRRRRRRP